MSLDFPGFLVWNPRRDMPTFQHETFERAEAEANRLARIASHGGFFIMAPVLTEEERDAAKAWSAGREQGRRESHLEIMHADARADRLADENFELRRRLDRLSKIEREVARWQSLVADCLCWFEGFNAVFALKDSWERPTTPDVGRLRLLNGAFQDATPLPQTELTDEEIPF